MSVSPKYENYEYTARGARLRSQSIVECRLSDWSENKILAVSPSVVLSGAEVLSGEVRYGGKLYFSVVARAPGGEIVGAERGAEFSHKAECESAAPAQSAEVSLFVEKVDIRPDGKSLILSAIVTAEIELIVPARLEYLAGGEGVVCDYKPVRVCRTWQCGGTAEIEEEFDTDYVGDVLLHSEQVSLTRVVAAAGCLDVSGEINLCVLAKREGESDLVSYERLIPFRAEIPCDEAVTGSACDARACVSSVNLSAACDEDKNRCRIAAQLTVDIRGRVYRSDEVVLPQDAFCPGYRSELSFDTVRCEEPACAFTASERVSGTAAVDGTVDFACSLQASALCGAQVFAESAEGEISAEGVLNAAVFMKNGDGLPESVRVSLPFAFPIRCDRAKPGMRAVVTATVCGVSVRQKKEGELEAEGALKLFVVLFEGTSSAYVSRLEAGEAEEEKRSAIGVHIPAAGDTLWITAKKLGKTPEEVQSSNPELTFPLSGGERIVVYRRKNIAM